MSTWYDIEVSVSAIDAAIETAASKFWFVRTRSRDSERLNSARSVPAARRARGMYVSSRTAAWETCSCWYSLMIGMRHRAVARQWILRGESPGRYGRHP